MNVLRRLGPHDLWGGCEIRPDPPGLGAFEDVLALPFRAGGVWGVFDRAGNALPGSLDLRGPEGALMDQVPACHPSAWKDAEPLPDPELVYAGRLIHHYGHFLLESLPRLWPWAQGGLGGRRLLIHPVGGHGFFAGLPYVRAVLEALGLAQDSFVIVDRPLQVRRLLVPHPSIRQQAFAHPAFRTLCRTIGERVLRGPGRRWPRLRRRNGRPVYLSKRWLLSGVRKPADEETLEHVLARAGVDIVHPELMTFPDQVRLWTERRTVLGTVGSGFHTSVFAPRPRRLIGLNLTDRLNSNFALLDALSGARAEYWRPDPLPPAEPGGETFAVVHRLQNPAGVARALLDLL